MPYDAALKKIVIFSGHTVSNPRNPADTGVFSSPRLACAADMNCSSTLTVQDVFGFLALCFASDFRADFNESLSLTIQDVFDDLAAYFAGCP